MKTYTFKIKLHYATDDHPIVLSVVHCPLEVLFDSLKEVKQFDELYKKVKDENNKEVPSMYITASDYVNNDGKYVFDDYIFCDYEAIIDSNSLKELLTHCNYYGFVDRTELAKTEQQIVESVSTEALKLKEKLKEEVDEDEV